jgi:S-DNA-T family DNA segregation ATPase FtsK/SpoIIIE
MSLAKGLRESAFLIYLAVALYLLIALITFDVDDRGWTHGGPSGPVANAAGAVGAWIADILLTAFGITAFLFPFLLAGYGYSVFLGRNGPQPGFADIALRWIGFMTATSAGAALFDTYIVRPPVAIPDTSGGLLGEHFAGLFSSSFGDTGAGVLLAALFLAGVSLYTGLSWLAVLDLFGTVAMSALRLAGILGGGGRDSSRESSPVEKSDSTTRRTIPKPRRGAESQSVKKHRIEPTSVQARPQPLAGPSVARIPPAAMRASPLSPAELPALSLLNSSAPKIRAYSQAALEEMSRQLEEILSDFGVDVQVTDIHPGPVITRFEIQPAPGVKVSRISGLAKDLARTLSVTSVRVVEIIPGKTVIGLEIPNEERELVLLHAVLASESYAHSQSPLTLVLGKDIAGRPVVANLARMPHLLVAGTTGSGKSVAVNVMILSMLYKARPEDVRLIMIDPKMLELSVYEGIPHLLTPVVTDMKEAANSLRWCVAEMERRYKLMSVMGVRNLAGFNQKIADAIAGGQPIRDPLWSPDLLTDHDEAPVLEPLPFIVIVIDELADMMMIVGKKVEELIARLAQKARAAGLHLILATQRPSVDVITGLIKANIPTRIAFQVSSKIDSRTILDQGGAESLLGNGDMLFLPPGTGLPMRAHGAFVSDQEVHNVVEFLKRTGPARYLQEITKFSEEGDFNVYKGSATGDAGAESDPLYDEAVRFVTESRKASISSVQRKFKVGYNRAARMIEDMERAGVVGAAETNGSREVLAPPPPME